MGFGSGQEFQGALVVCLGPDLGIQSEDGFDVVIQYFRSGFQNPVKRRLTASQIGDKNFDSCTGASLADGGYCPGHMISSSVGKIVAADHGQNTEIKSQTGNRPGGPVRFFRVRRSDHGFVHGAEGALPGAGRAQKEESGCTPTKTIHLVGTLGLLADSVETEII
jgi:hypothetical protein